MSTTVTNGLNAVLDVGKVNTTNNVSAFVDAGKVNATNNVSAFVDTGKVNTSNNISAFVDVGRTYVTNNLNVVIDPNYVNAIPFIFATVIEMNDPSTDYTWPLDQTELMIDVRRHCQAADRRVKEINDTLDVVVATAETGRQGVIDLGNRMPRFTEASDEVSLNGLALVATDGTQHLVYNMLADDGTVVELKGIGSTEGSFGGDVPIDVDEPVVNQDQFTEVVSTLPRYVDRAESFAYQRRQIALANGKLDELEQLTAQVNDDVTAKVADADALDHAVVRFTYID